MVRRELGIPTVKWNYDQSAVVAVLHLSEVSNMHNLRTQIFKQGLLYVTELIYSVFIMIVI